MDLPEEEEVEEEAAKKVRISSARAEGSSHMVLAW